MRIPAAALESRGFLHGCGEIVSALVRRSIRSSNFREDTEMVTSRCRNTTN